jgi:hypothetical protein
LASSLANTAMPIFVSMANASFSAMPSVSRIVRRIARTATGPFAAISSAIDSAVSSAVPSGTTRPISPIDSASAAVMCRPVSSSSHAMVYGICRGSPATRMSQACRISVPPAMAGPSTAAISGFVSRRPLSSGSITDRSRSARSPG